MADKPILFVDFDGTLCHDRFWHTLPPLHYQRVQAKLFGADRMLLDSWMRGEVDSHFVCGQLADENLPAASLLAELERSCRAFAIDSALLDRLAALRQSFHLVLMTTNMDCFQWVVECQGFENRFDQIVNSADHGLFKDEQDGLLFRQVAGQAGVPMTQCWLIDDSDLVCRLFTKLGGGALLVDERHPTLDWLDSMLIST